MSRPTNQTTAQEGRAKRVLLIAPHFGEDGGTGAFRWNKMVPEIVEHGWSFDVLTVATSEFQVRDLRQMTADSSPVRVFAIRQPRWPETLVGHLLAMGRRSRRFRASGRPPATEKVRSGSTKGTWQQPSDKPFQRITSILWSVARSYGELRWTWRAFRLGRRLIRAGGHRVIIVSSPPHTPQLAGIFLGRRTSALYVPDYRDPWGTVVGRKNYLMHPAETFLGRRYQPISMREARFIIFCNDVARRAAAETHQRNGACVAITNGWDERTTVERPDRNCFLIVYTGALYPYHDVGALFAACRRFQDRSGLSAEKLRIEFMGVDPKLGGVRVANLADNHKLRDSFVLHAPAPRDEALQLQQTAAVLVSFDHFHGKSCPMKFYDIVQTYGYPLFIGGTSGALAQQAAKIGLHVIDPTDTPRLDKALDAAYERWQTYRYDQTADPTGVFDRRHQTRRMLELLERCAGDE